jgi:hypothetical protein
LLQELWSSYNCGYDEHLKDKLANLENRLQSLVEGSGSRSTMFPGDTSGLAGSLLAAMRAGVELGPLGETIAPDLYTLVVHPDYVVVLKEDPALLPGLAAGLHQAGVGAGLRFQAAPQIKMPQTLSPGQLDSGPVKISHPNLDETSSVPLERAIH